MFMGKVVDIESPARRKRGKARRRPSKTALVLGGGGFTGGVYEIGALRALDLLAVNSTVNNFDVYVGTSAGSFVATMLANGVTPDEMMQVINKREPSEFEDLDLDKVLKLNYLGFLQKAAMLPLRTAELVRRHYPDIPVYARARNRTHVHKLMDLGVTVIERETFRAALEIARQTLRGMGLSEAEVRRTIATFSEMDTRRLVADYQIASATVFMSVISPAATSVLNSCSEKVRGSMCSSSSCSAV